MKALLLSKEAIQCLEAHLLSWLGSWVVPWPNEGLTYLQAPMELSGPWRVPYKSRRFQNTLHNSMYKPMYKNIQDISRILQKALNSSYAFHHSVEMCGHFQASLEPSTLFSPMAQCRQFQEFPEASQALYKPRGRLI